MFRKGGRKYWKRDYGNGPMYTGKIQPNYFFRRARESMEGEISANMERILAESIKKVYEKSR
jgi:hypothetical protein